ncbi:MAG: hypothetical protein KKD31_15340 [Bacteroidetes bacterium]|nr:hypothetical protein [Bacteroidota bacterium]
MKVETQLHNRIHTQLYEEILKGKYRPHLSKFDSPENLKSLFVETQTRRFSFNDDISGKYMEEEPEMNAYGFKNSDHFTYTIHNGRKPGVWDLTIIPVLEYELRENIQIPYYPSLKAETFTALICDEFERIKIKADCVLERTESIDQLRLYATKNITRAKKLHHDAQILLSKLQKDKKTEVVFIVFILDLFIIQTICYFQKHFKSYLPKPHASEHKLKSELFSLAFSGHSGFVTGEWHEKKPQPVNADTQSISSVSNCESDAKKPHCYYQGFPEVEGVTYSESDPKKPQPENTGVSEQVVDYQYSQSGLNDLPIDFDDTPSESPANKGEAFLPTPHKRQKHRINKQTNVFCDAWEQLTQEEFAGGEPMLTMSYPFLRQHIFDNYLDKHGNEFCFPTLRTLLSPGRSEKKLHPDSPKRIDLSRFYPNKKPSNRP